MRIKLYLYIIASIVASSTSSCSEIDEKDCKVSYVNYRYLNNVGIDATGQIYKMTDFIFSKQDSVLRFVNSDIMNGKMRRRPITLPDGEWIVVTYGNLNGGSKVDYTIGSTKFSQMSVRVINAPTYKGTYAMRVNAPSLIIGDADKLYFGNVDLVVRGGYTDRIHTVDMSNVHIWLSAVVKWRDTSKAPIKASDNLHIRLEHVPVEHRFLHDSNHDHNYDIPYKTPRITTELATHISSLKTQSYTSNGEFYFDTYGLRWETDNAPILRFYDGENMLLEKELDLNRYFSDQRIDLTNTRVQFYQLEILIDDDRVTISSFGIGPWEDGGDIS